VRRQDRENDEAKRNEKALAGLLVEFRDHAGSPLENIPAWR